MKLPRLLFAILLATFATTLPAALRLASPFGDHMVLQRDQPITVWGWADPAATISVAFADQSVTATADSTGAWRTTLAPLATSATPRELTVTAQLPESDLVSRKTFSDVVVGEVWLCGGQSNMERQLGPRRGQKPLVGWEAEVAAADRPLLRQLYVNQTRSPLPADTVEAAWSVCTPATAVDFTAVGYYFARDLQAALGADVPVGILHSSWGGTPAEAWTSAAGLADFPEFAPTIADLRDNPVDPAAASARYLASLETWFAAHDPGQQSDHQWFLPQPRDPVAAWPTMDLPTLWEDVGHDGYDGVGWFRRTFDLPAGWAGHDLIVHLGPIDDSDTTWLNGTRIGATAGYNRPRTYRLPADLLRPTGNVLAVRVLDTGGGGGLWGETCDLRLVRADGEDPALSLEGPWSYQLVADLKSTPYPPLDLSTNAGAPTGLFNGMIAPLAPYAIRGVAFYQGENNADRATQYRTLLPALIEDWRQQWNAPDLPFLFVQIAPFQGQPPEIREAQLLAWQATPNTAMVVTIDIGDATDIHPAQKEPVGARLALAARALAYDENLAYSGPVYDGATIDDDTVIIRFTHLAHGLVAPGGILRGFTVAGDDGVFHPATARIVGDTVEVRSLDVPAPTAVRYAWANVADGNLFNTAGLPASPFRSDSP